MAHTPGEDEFPADEYDYPLVATQPQTQSQHCPYKPELDEELVGCLIPASENSQRFDLLKTKKDGVWNIGRHPTNDFILPGARLSKCPSLLSIRVLACLAHPCNFRQLPLQLAMEREDWQKIPSCARRQLLQWHLGE